MSVAVKATVQDPPACAATGVQANVPVVGLNDAPVGRGLVKLNTCSSSVSDAVTLNVSRDPALTIWGPGTVSVGGVFAVGGGCAETTTTWDAVAEFDALSVAFNVTVYVLDAV